MIYDYNYIVLVYIFQPNDRETTYGRCLISYIILLID